jgi:hypothetical protein
VLSPWLVLACAAVCARLAGGLMRSTLADLLTAALSFVAVGYLGLTLFSNDSLQLVLASSTKILGKFGGRHAYPSESA